MIKGNVRPGIKNVAIWNRAHYANPDMAPYILMQRMNAAYQVIGEQYKIFLPKYVSDLPSFIERTDAAYYYGYGYLAVNANDIESRIDDYKFNVFNL